jgi:hypothetical protein
MRVSGAELEMPKNLNRGQLGSGGHAHMCTRAFVFAIRGETLVCSGALGIFAWSNSRRPGVYSWGASHSKKVF